MKNKKRKRLVWIISLLVIIAYVIVGGKYNSKKNSESLSNLYKAKEFYDNGDVLNALEIVKKIERPQIRELYPELKAFYNTLESIIEQSTEELNVILGRYEDNYIEENVTIILMGDNDRYYNLPFVKLRGWAPKVEALFPLKISITFNDNSIWSSFIYQNGFFELDVPINNTINISKGSMLRLSCDKNYNPSKLFLSNDVRDLSIQLQSIEVFDYLNYFNASNVIKIKGIYEDKWMGKAIDMDIFNVEKNVKGVKITGIAPKEIQYPTMLYISDSMGIIKEHELEKDGEFDISIDFPERLIESKLIQVNINSENVYSPKVLGINKDERDLSVKINNIEIIKN